MSAEGGGGRPRAPDVPERFVPEEHGPIPAYEHAHRYAFAARAVSRGSRVLDLACGTGYGTRILERAGARVVPLDQDRRALQSGCVSAQAESLPFADSSFDVVVCFEAIEHVTDPSIVIAEIDRVLRADGFALLSTPERRIYSERAGNRNPFHLTEMDREEFGALLTPVFPHLRLYGQSVWAGSWMARLGDRDPASDAEERRARVLLDPLPHDAAQPPWVDPEEQAFPVPLFVVAVCTRSAEWAGRLEERLGLESVLQDPRQILLGDYFDTLEGLALRDRQIEEFAAHAEALQARVRVTDERIASLELHARNLEELHADELAKLAAIRTHAANLEGLRAGQSADLAAWRTCAATLEAGVVEHEEFYRQLSSHARALEEWTGGLQRHAQHLEQVVSQLRAHVINLEQRLQERCERVASLEAHASHLEPTVSGLRGHAENLEAALERRDERIVELETHAQNLERVLAERSRDFEAELAELTTRRDALQADLDEFHSSSWLNRPWRRRLESE